MCFETMLRTISIFFGSSPGPTFEIKPLTSEMYANQEEPCDVPGRSINARSVRSGPDRSRQTTLSENWNWRFEPKLTGSSKLVSGSSVPVSRSTRRCTGTLGLRTASCARRIISSRLDLSCKIGPKGSSRAVMLFPSTSVSQRIKTWHCHEWPCSERVIRHSIGHLTGIKSDKIVKM